MDYKIAASGELPINQLVNFVKLVAATGAVEIVADAFVPGIDGEVKPVTLTHRLVPGRSINYGFLVNGITVRNTLAAVNSIDLEIGLGAIDDDSIAGAVEITALPPRTLVTRSRTQPAALGATTIVAPGANVNGIRIDQIICQSNGNQTVGVLSGTTTPATTFSTSHRLLAWHFEGTTAKYFHHPHLTTMPYVIPAGEGLYVYAFGAGGDVSIDYEVL